ncbi:hypothetical protein [Paractinoplanes atraurantiacus]|uniref:Uncharacterized protein n=1 Tax=Paractinoplanes atraurantiacus TaxID=1036182 RepID=A0A285JGG5_9ACTN|nr:hypothetical protein [Actinoplanes atraurantiacus]SNY58241.1 hypothetical protein SAMN05421748_11943 [Actinoplanes atraurantiacus]
MIDATRQLRWYSGLGLLFLAFIPVLSFTLLATDPGAADNELIPVFIGGPVNLAGAAFVIRSMTSREPAASSRMLAIGGALILLGDVLLIGIRAAIT